MVSSDVAVNAVEDSVASVTTVEKKVELVVGFDTSGMGV